MILLDAEENARGRWYEMTEEGDDGVSGDVGDSVTDVAKTGRENVVMTRGEDEAVLQAEVEEVVVLVLMAVAAVAGVINAAATAAEEAGLGSAASHDLSLGLTSADRPNGADA